MKTLNPTSPSFSSSLASVESLLSTTIQNPTPNPAVATATTPLMTGSSLIVATSTGSGSVGGAVTGSGGGSKTVASGMVASSTQTGGVGQKADRLRGGVDAVILGMIGVGVGIVGVF